MKIPETSANVAAYYGNEENGQWQTNGVTLEAGGGPAAGGDAGFLPLYPHPHAHAHPHPHPHQHPHPRAHHDPAYIMTGAYYPSAYQPLQPLPAHPHVHHAPVAPPPPPAAPDDFADYMWMENEEEFDKQVMQQLEEEALMEQCIEAMLEDERERAGDRRRPHANGHRNAAPNSSNGTTASLQEQVSKSKLNPLAAEFVPTGSRTAPPGAPEAAPPSPAERDGELPNEDETEEKPAKPPTPEVSAAGCDLLPAERTARHTDAHDDKQQEVSDTTEASAAPSESSESDTSLAKSISESKELPESARTSRAEPRKPKPKPASARPAVDAKKSRDVRRQKHSSERPAEPRGEPEVTAAISLDSDKGLPRSPPPEESSTVPKPINYAAAAKANKPKKSSPAPAQPAQSADKVAPAPNPTSAASKSQDRQPRSEKTATAAKSDKSNARKTSNK